MTHTARLTLTVVFMALTFACGASQAQAPAPSPAVPSPIASPTPNIPALAAQYLAVAEPLNARGDAVKKATDFTNEASVRAYSVEGAKIHADYVQGVRAIKFPESMHADVSELVAATIALQLALEQVARREGWYAMMADFNAMTPVIARRQAAVDNIRRDLGLPSAP